MSRKSTSSANASIFIKGDKSYLVALEFEAFIKEIEKNFEVEVTSWHFSVHGTKEFNEEPVREERRGSVNLVKG